MHRVPARYQPLIVAAASMLVVLVVVGAILLVGRIAPPPSPSPAPVTPTASATPDVSTPEGAVRAFFEAFARARRTDDPSLVLPFTTGAESSAYRSVEGFLLGQKEVGKASVTTVLRFENFTVSIEDDTSTVAFDFTEGGYDIDLETGEALESPVVLPATRVTVELRRAEGRWLVERYRSSQ